MAASLNSMMMLLMLWQLGWGGYGDSQMAPHLLENTRNRLGNGRPNAEPDPGIAMTFLSRPPGLAVTAGAGLRRKSTPEAAGRVPFREAT